MSPETLIGMELGKSALQRRLGQGTMGTVYLAYQTSLQREVAVKLFSPASALEQNEREEFQQRLKEALNLGASLEHKHILAILDHGEEKGLIYEVTPYVAGENLQSHLVHSGALPFTQIQQYLEQLVAALEYAHSRNILHCDIKPGNILLTPEGDLLLADFGLAALTTEKNFARVRQPQPGMLNYIAPEYLLSKAVDQRTDLYSLGAVLYHMVTGVPPFQGASLSETAMKHTKEQPPSPCSLRQDLPQAAEQVILRALAKRPADRYSHVQDLASAFRLALEATDLLPTESQKTNALDMLSDLASGGATAKVPRVSLKRNTTSLFDPKWQTVPQAALTKEQLAPSTPILPELPASTKPAGETARLTHALSPLPQTYDQPAESTETVEQVDFPANLPADPSASSLNFASQKPPRSGLLRLARLQGNEQTEMNGQQNWEAAADNPLKLENPPASTTEGLNFPSQIPPRSITGWLGTQPVPLEASDGNTGTMKLTEPVKIVQVPVAGQPGRYMTGFLPALPSEAPSPPPTATPGLLNNKRFRLIGLVLALCLVIAGSGIFLRSTHQQAPQQARGPAGQPTPNTAATSAAFGAATAQANIILSDDLSQNIHNWPIGTQGHFTYTFQNGAYYIANNDAKQGASALLPARVVTQPFAYTLKVEQTKGDQKSPNNQFGIIFDASIQKVNNKQIDRFYAFEVLNKAGGEYQFWKYDNGKNSTNPWTSLWTKTFGKEFLQGSGPTHTNTFKVAVNGSTFTFLMNGKQVGSKKDTTLSSGDVGMLVNLDGAEVAFSHLLLTYA